MEKNLNFDYSISLIEETKTQWHLSTGQTIDDAQAINIINCYAELMLYIINYEFDGYFKEEISNE